MLQRLLIATFTETLQRYKEDFSSLLQHMADCYKALLADKLSCASKSVAIVHPVNECKSIRALHKNINTVAMLTCDALLCHFRKGMCHGGNGQLHTLNSYVLLISCIQYFYLFPGCYVYRPVINGQRSIFSKE